jgi:hypothetical protein
MEKQDIYSIYLDYFKGREDCFACQGRDYYHPIRSGLTIEYLKKHLEDLSTFGIYVLTSDSKCNFVCIDIDIPKTELCEVDICNPKAKYLYLKDKLYSLLELLKDQFNISEEEILLEDTGGRGYHIWLFFTEPIPGEDALRFYYICKSVLNYAFEFFPKQPNLTDKRKYGNLIKLPLGTHQKYDSKSSFFEIVNGDIKYQTSLDDNIEHLAKIKKLNRDKFYNIINKYADIVTGEIEGLSPADVYEKYIEVGRILYKQDFDFLFNHCDALNKLRKKAEHGIELSHNEAFHFTNILLSVDNGTTFTIEILKKSFGPKYRKDITLKEIENIRPLQAASCKKLVGQNICDNYCNEEIRKRNTDPLLTNTSPVSFWLIPLERITTIKHEEILGSLADPENIINAYWRLKKYHKDEDVGFYDEFDFEFFESNLEINAKYIARALETKENIPFVGYLKINLPKKVDQENRMHYRQMTYSTIFDQVLIQGIFNIVSQFLESEFQDYSYGYRCDLTNTKSENIFYDWREYYPYFRNRVLVTLRQNNIKYYICSDIKGFYDNVRHDLLIEQLRRYVKDNYVMSIIEKVVQLYHFEESSNTGLPQGPAYARVLANLYLNEFDKEIINHSSGFLRYVDDFFLFYESKEQAEKGLSKIFQLLNDLGLSLSDDEKKKPEILEASDESKIISKLDSIQYGIFEEFKFIDHLDVQQVNDFYKAIERDRVSANDREEILEINNKLPYLLYLISKKIKYYHSIENKILAIINYLVDHKLFYPKRLKYIFYKIIDLLEIYTQDITIFYTKLDDAHKIYFLLALFKKYKNDNKHAKELKDIIKQSIESANYFICGLGIVINQEFKEQSGIIVNESQLINKIHTSPTYFPKLKYYSTINYFNSSPEHKNFIRKEMTGDNLYLEKKYLLGNAESVNIEYVDNLFIEKLLANNSYFLILDCCSLLCSIGDDNQLFRKLVRYISESVNYKDLIVFHLTSLLYERLKSASQIELDNRLALYNEIRDEEIKRELINVINAIKKVSYEADADFIKVHTLIDKYCQCYLYKNENKLDMEYDYIEIIPRLKLNEYGYVDYNAFNNYIRDLSYNQIVPKLEFQHDSVKNIVRIKYVVENGYEELNRTSFTLKKEDILFVLELTEKLYKKARYYFGKFRRLPSLSAKNILINRNKKDVQFRNIGSMLCPFYLIAEKKIRNDSESEIPKIISMLLDELFFENDPRRIKEFRQKSLKVGMELFLSNIMARMASDDPYPYSRYSYIIQQLSQTNVNSDLAVSNLYFRERLKSQLYKRNMTLINWQDICSGLNDLYGELAVTYRAIEFKNINYTNKISLNFNVPRGLHYLSKMILNLCLNEKNITRGTEVSNDFVNIFILLNYYALMCIEAMSFFKIGIESNKKKLKELALSENICLRVGEYSVELNKLDVNSIHTLIVKEMTGHGVFEPTNNYSLKQMACFYLLRNYVHEFNGKDIIIKNENVPKDSHFNMLAYNLLIRLQKIEVNINNNVSKTIYGLKINQDYQISNEDLAGLKSEIMNFCSAINASRRKIKCKRHYGYINKWPPDIYYRLALRQRHRTTQSSTYKIPLTNLFPSSKSKCSWDMMGNDVANIVVPNERIKKLIGMLSKGKFFGKRIDYIYSEKMKVVWDACMISLLMFLFFRVPLKINEIYYQHPTNLTTGMLWLSKTTQREKR